MRYGAISIADSGGVSFQTNGSISVSGTAGSLSLTSGGGGTTSAGGTFTLQSGSGGSTSGNGGDLNLIAGSAPTSGVGGSVSLTAGAAAGTNQAGGNITLTAGAPTGTGTSGSVSLIGASNTGSVGGNVVLRGGRGSSAANDGVIKIDRTSTDNRATRLQLVAGPTNANTVSISAPASVTSSYEITLPAAQGAASSFLQNNGSGALSWAAGTGKLLQTLFTQLTADTTTTSTTYVDLLTQAITTTSGNSILISFTASGSNTTNNRLISFQLLIDGTATRGTAFAITRLSNTPQSCALVYLASVSAGAHTIKIQWKTEANTAEIRPATQTDEHASLIVQEVTP